MNHTAILFNAAQGHSAFTQAWMHAKAMLLAGHRLTLTVKPEKRNVEQNAKLHALLTEIAAQVEWAGKRWSVEDWKRLLTAGWLRARKESAIVVPAIDGHGFDVLYRHTSSLSKAEFSELIDYVQAWAAEHGVRCAE